MTDEPSTFDHALAESLCDRVAGGETLAALCTDGAMPSLEELKGWLRENSEFARTLDLAIQARREHFLDEMKEVETKLLGGRIDVAEAEATLDKLKRLVEYSDMPVGIW